jgi:hypothetical protein
MSGLSVGAAPNTYLAYRYGVKELMRIGQGMGSGFQSVMQKVPIQKYRQGSISLLFRSQ